MPKLTSLNAWHSSFNPWAEVPSEEGNSSFSSTELDTTTTDSSGEEETSDEQPLAETPAVREELQLQLDTGTRPTLSTRLRLTLAIQAQ